MGLIDEELQRKHATEERLLNFMNQNADMKATALLPALKGNIDIFVGEAPQFDDLTMLGLKYNGSENTAGTEDKHEGA